MTQVNTQINAADLRNNAYDDVPYESFPYPQSTPHRIATIATLFGVNATNHKKARVLELGCASGGNIIPLACNNPNAEYVGIDLSKIQIEQGQQQIKQLGLKNISLQQLDISAVDASLGKFDYIICHGILSWVPQSVQDSIFKIFDQNLNDNGIAYVSYNTYPGWNMVKSIRDMMLYHVKNFGDAQTKLNQAIQLLEFILKANEGAKESAYYKTIESELKLLKAQNPTYIMHDHLEAYNEPFYFNQIVDKAAQNNLSYLGDSDISTMYAGNFSGEAAQTLAQVNDINRQEQYMDFLRNRRFRQSIFVKNTTQINRQISSDTIGEFILNTNVATTTKLDKNNLQQLTEPVEFTNNKGLNFKIGTRDLAALLYTMQTTEKITSFDKYLAKVKQNFGLEISAEDKTKLAGSINELVLRGILNISLDAPKFANKASAKPKALSLVATQISTQNWVTNSNHATVRCDSFDKILLANLDGTNDVKKLSSIVAEAITNNSQLNYIKDGNTITDKKEIEKLVSSDIKNRLQNYARNGLLES